MPKYAFGIAARDEQIARSDANNLRRQQNINDIFNGLGVLAQSVGIAHRMAQERSDQRTLANLYANNFNESDTTGSTTPSYEPGPAMASPYPQVDTNQAGWSTRGPQEAPAQTPVAAPSVGDRLANIGGMFNNPQYALKAMELMKGQQAAALRARNVESEIGYRKSMGEAALANAGREIENQNYTRLTDESKSYDRLQAQVDRLTSARDKIDRLLLPNGMNDLGMAMLATSFNKSEEPALAGMAEALGQVGPEKKLQLVTQMKAAADDQIRTVQERMGPYETARATRQERFINPLLSRRGAPHEAVGHQEQNQATDRAAPVIKDPEVRDMIRFLPAGVTLDTATDEQIRAAWAAKDQAGDR